MVDVAYGRTFRRLGRVESVAAGVRVTGFRVSLPGVSGARADMLSSMEFRLLGPLEVISGEKRIPMGGPKQRALFAVLLLHPNEVVSDDRLIEAIWSDAPPPNMALRCTQQASVGRWARRTVWFVSWAVTACGRKQVSGTSMG